ncbi:MaoC family dehydratase N-terminal domain-containing protein [Glaciimonas sp. PAMC28666]|uniref:FAS1-like dehydratase domain-containing protein n=1 Tax=Glaciimonas sp. PAMC28666 TaxID=2807626 RepID=UPI001964D8B1|nr:MaoC family dehydratase N-terminal domain-containing protein [Glaciimonas sp. PAMC28666]QRX83495.1 MaoC family dehydratase N-terminal domain-containing protein [Glaciimonas sp. PAMC28666]
MTIIPESLDITLLQQWVGKTETHHDVINASAASALAATLDHQQSTLAAPNGPKALRPLWHWIYFWAVCGQSDVGSDGHPQRGGFLPPVPLPRRMWAGGRLTFSGPLPIGAAASRTSQIMSVTEKSGKSGSLAFVTVKHEIAVDGIVAITEEHDIVYRALAEPGAIAPPPKLAPSEALWTRTVHPDPVLLFRYSALTFNGHRIHYDRSYVTEVEGYPGLIVHGPLIATLLVDLLLEHMPEAQLATFNFRAIGPLFDIASFDICGQPDADGRTVHLWARNARGELAMQAEATLLVP